MNSPAYAKHAQTGNPRWPSKAGAVLIYLLISTQLVGCGYFTKKPDTNALCIAECPDLTALPDDTFGSTSKKLKEVADQYYLCRAACQVKR